MNVLEFENGRGCGLD